jgi:hypothetical protein
VSNPISRWEMLNHALQHYLLYIKNKENKYHITIIDLIFISNFKGGNASITEPVVALNKKIQVYSRALEVISEKFEGRKLQSLRSDELDELLILGDGFISLADNRDTKIRGFGPSYASALLSAHFVELFPILDRRILNGIGIDVDYDSQKQVKNIAKHFKSVIIACYDELKKDPKKTLRELDREYFIKQLV